MGEVRVVSAVENAKVKNGNELPKPIALVVVQFIGFIWMGIVVARLVYIVFNSLAVVFMGEWGKLGDVIGSVLFDSVFLTIALAFFAIPFLSMYFGMKKSRYFIPVFCPWGVLMACAYLPSFISIVVGLVPPVAIWLCPSIRKWYSSLV